jgi:hypothetical protein
MMYVFLGECPIHITKQCFFPKIDTKDFFFNLKLFLIKAFKDTLKHHVIEKKSGYMVLML